MPWYNDPALWSWRIGDPDAPDFGTVYHEYNLRLAQRIEGPYDDTPTYYLKRAGWLISRLESFGLNSEHRIMIVGACFGYLLYAFRYAGYTNTWGLEIDTYFRDNQATQGLPGLDVSNDIEYDSILNITKQQLKSKLVQRTGDWTFEVVITDDLVPSYSNPVLLDVAQACEVMCRGTDYRRIIHLVTDVKPGTTHDPAAEVYMRYMTLAEWSALRPGHTWISLIDGATIIGTG